MRNSSMCDTVRCKDCGWNVVNCLCNDEMAEGNYSGWDWWVYCSNKGCKNHNGEGYFQDTVDWIEEVENEQFVHRN